VKGTKKEQKKLSVVLDFPRNVEMPQHMPRSIIGTLLNYTLIGMILSSILTMLDLS
jgi:hypothetical protein